MVLLALVDANYNFVNVETESNGRISNGGVFSNSALYQNLEQNNLGIPLETPLPKRTLPVPYNIVADHAFPLKPYLLKPFSRSDLWNVAKRVFNYRLSRARRTVDNAFGILASRFRIFNKPILLDPSKVD